jgi:hypothetical protein
LSGCRFRELTNDTSAPTRQLAGIHVQFKIRNAGADRNLHCMPEHLACFVKSCAR